MTSRRAVVDTFEKLAFAAELLDDPRARVYGQAAWALRNLSGDVRELRASGELEKVRGVGKSTLAIVDAVLEGQPVPALEALKEKLPEGLFEVRRIKGLGAKKVKALWSELGISSLGELEYACRENRLLDLKGFGKKTQASILEQITAMRAIEGAIRRDHAEALMMPFVRAIGDHPGVTRAQIVGDYRRGAELVRDLQVLIAGDDVEAALAAHPPPPSVRVNFASVANFGTASVRTTGSAAHLEALQERAARAGASLDGHAEEEDLYRALGLIETAPERREDGIPLVEIGKARPRLVRREDLQGALHNHTIASDGTATLEAMRAAAAARGLRYLGISDHSHTAFYARGLEAERLLEQAKVIDAINTKSSIPCILLTGVESDILEHGELDYDVEVLRRLEVVVASVHKRYAQDAAAMTARMVAAASHPCTAIVGHPTGRLLLGRAASVFDVGAFLDACAASGCAVELNANPARLDLSVEHAAMAKERGVLVSIAADAHAEGELDHLEHGVAIARRAGLGPEDVLNTRSLAELRVWLDARAARVTASS